MVMQAPFGQQALLRGLGGFSQGFLGASQQPGARLGTALLGGASGLLPGLAQGAALEQRQRNIEQARQDDFAVQQARRQAAMAQLASEEQRAADRLAFDRRKEARLQTADDRAAEKMAFDQGLALQKLEQGRQQIEISRARAQQGPAAVQALVAAGIDPQSEEGRAAILANLTKPQVAINQPKLPAGQVFVDPQSPELGTIKMSDIGKAQQVNTNLNAALDRYENALRASGGQIVPGTAKDELKASRTDVLLQLKELNELGAITGPDMELMNALVIDPTSISGNVADVFSMLGGSTLGERALANVESLREQSKARLDSILNPAGQQIAPQAAQSVMPADLGSMSMEQLLQLQSSLSAGNP